MKRFISVFLLLSVILAGCGSATPATTTAAPTALPPTETAEPITLIVFAASSLTDAFTEIGQNFEAVNPGVAVTFNFAGSQALSTQIEEGAPADVFASANITEMNNLISAKFITDGSQKVFSHNKLVVILPANNPANLSKLDDLKISGIKIVLAAEEVPVGKYARQALEQMNAQYESDFKDKVLANVVSNEDNVKQVVAKVQLGEADAGIVYMSDAIATPELKTIEIPTELNVFSKNPIAPLVNSENIDLAMDFIAYVRSSEALVIFHKWGFVDLRKLFQE